jgi:thioredoxin-dependent peroxiredoxin
MTQLVEGDPAPDFSLPADAGGSISLRAMRGSKIVLYFYPKDDSGLCVDEAIAFNGLRAKFIKADTQIIGISPDSTATHSKFKRKRGLELTLASDESRSVLEAYGVWREKSLYGRRYMGVERTTVLVDAEGVIARVWRKVRVAGHAEQVLAAARALPAKASRASAPVRPTSFAKD